MDKKIEIHIGNWRGVVVTIAICATVVLSSEIWSKYFIEAARIEVVRQANSMTEKNMPPSMKMAMGGPETDYKRKKNKM